MLQAVCLVFMSIELAFLSMGCCLGPHHVQELHEAAASLYTCYTFYRRFVWNFKKLYLYEVCHEGMFS